MATLITNKYIRGSYDLLDTWEVGIVLTGPEVKSVRARSMSLRGAYVILKENALWLIGAHISPYLPAKTNQRQYDPDRPRKLLAHKRELHSLVGKLNEKGLTILPVSVYTKARLIKLQIGLVRGKSKRDKREVIKKRDVDREIRRRTKLQYR